MFNATIIGNLGRDSELKHLDSGNVLASFSIAANVRKGREDTTVWVRCTIWGKFAEAMSQYLVKGQKVAVTGDVTTSQYVTNDGETKFSVECNVDKLELVGRKESPPSGNNDTAASQSNEPADFDDDEDIPF